MVPVGWPSLISSCKQEVTPFFQNGGFGASTCVNNNNNNNNILCPRPEVEAAALEFEKCNYVTNDAL